MIGSPAEQRAPLGVRDDVLEQRDRQPLADARALVDLLILARLERDLLDDFADERRDAAASQPPRSIQASCAVIAIACWRVAGIVRADLRADAVLERRDDLAARRVVLRVGAEDHHDVERQPHRVALDLDVAFLKDVEEADLDLAGEVGQLVDREDAAVRARQQPVVHRQLVGELQAGARGLDRIEVADQVGDRDVGRRQLLDVARVAVEPADRQVVAGLARRARGTPRRAAPAGRRGSRSPGTTGIASSSRSTARAGCGSSPGRAGRAG